HPGRDARTSTAAPGVLASAASAGDGGQRPGRELEISHVGQAHNRGKQGNRRLCRPQAPRGQQGRRQDEEAPVGRAADPRGSVRKPLVALGFERVLFAPGGASELLQIEEKSNGRRQLARVFAVGRSLLEARRRSVKELAGGALEHLLEGRAVPVGCTSSPRVQARKRASSSATIFSAAPTSLWRAFMPRATSCSRSSTLKT